MLRFVLDCALIRPVDAQARGWLTAAEERGWAASHGGYHEAKMASALLDQAATTLADLASPGGGAGCWFAGDAELAVRGAVTDLAASGRFTSVSTSRTDSEVVQRGTRAAADALGLPHHVVAVDAAGRIELAGLPATTILVTFAGNQEIGCLQTDLGSWRDDTDSALIVDAGCAFGWTALPAAWDALLLDPRAWGAPAGAWAVVTASAGPRRDFADVAAAVTAGLAAQRWLTQAPDARERTRSHIARIAARVADEIADVDIHGAGAGDLPHILSISVLYVDAEALQGELDRLGFAVGSGSACASRAGEPSHVLGAIGGLTSGNVRLGLPPDLPEDAVDSFVDALAASVVRLRGQMGLA